MWTKKLKDGRLFGVNQRGDTFILNGTQNPYKQKNIYGSISQITSMDQIGDRLYVCLFADSSRNPKQVHYHVFDLASEAWMVILEDTYIQRMRDAEEIF